MRMMEAMIMFGLKGYFAVIDALENIIVRKD